MKVEIAKFVRVVGRGESIDLLINEMKSLTWQFEAEHAVVVLADRTRLLVCGGRDGISFFERDDLGSPTLHMSLDGRDVRVVRLLGHTHPQTTGPSQHDFDVLTMLGQSRSYLFEIGEMSSRGTLIRPKPGGAGR